MKPTLPQGGLFCYWSVNLQVHLVFTLLESQVKT